MSLDAQVQSSKKAARLEVDRVRVSRGNRQILNQISLTVECPSVIGLIGPNGAGKTTLLKSMLGVLPVDSGQVLYAEHNVNKCSSAFLAQNIGYMAQGAPCHWPMAVEDIVAFGRMPFHGSVMRLKSADYTAIYYAMMATGVVHLAKRNVQELSGGERARVMLARTLAGEPSLLLVDEPVAGLDPHYQLQVMEVLRNQAALGCRVVIVLHDLSLTARYCDRVVLLNRGQILADGAPEEVLTRTNLAMTYDVSCHITKHEDQMVVLPWSLQKTADLAEQDKPQKMSA